MSGGGRAEVDRAMGLLREGLGPFVARQVVPTWRFKEFVTSNTWLEGKRIGQWDVAALLKFMQYMWRDAFRHVLGRSERALVTELQDWRNKWAHQEPLALEDIDRALDSAARLLRAVDAGSQAAEVARLRDGLAEPWRSPDVSPRRAAANRQSKVLHGSQADAIREYALANYVVPWRESDADMLAIRAGDVERAMGLRNATPNVCNALEGRKFLSLANLALVRRDGPRRSTTTTYHYRSTG